MLLCLRSAEINFLPRDRGAEWIIFPSAVDIQAHRVVSFDTIFVREFRLDEQPPSARLRVRAAKRLELKINGRPIELPAKNNWKDITEVAVQLQAGTNRIEARVFHEMGMPALWLALSAGAATVRTDESWSASFADSSWRGAALADNPRIPGPGNELYGGEKTLDSLRLVWPWWCVFAAAAVAILLAGHFLLWRKKASAALPPRAGVVALIGAAILWCFLFWNNASRLPTAAGFDVQAHLEYIQYLQDHRALPWPNEGVEMFQPPLFYLIAALVLSVGKVSAASTAGVLVVRGLTMVFGIAHFSVVFLTLRLVWPAYPGRQLVGVLLAAFLPMNLYLSHYCTNETLAALLVSLSLFLTLRVLRQRQLGWATMMILGLTSGAAALTKFTAFLAFPFIVGALAVQLITRRAELRGWVKLTALAAVALLVSGWHYARIARHAGRLVIGGWDPASGYLWWQEDGYRVAAYFARFGESLVRPFFSASTSFADGIYATVWGDGLCAGVSALTSRVPWNYAPMSAGYLLAIIPSILILVGFAVAVVRWAKRGVFGILVGVSLALLGGLIYLNLKVPAYASVKAFYGLSALTPLAFFAALGWDRVTRGRRILQLAVAAALLVWAINSYASVWVRESAAERIYHALRDPDHDAQHDAADLRKAIELDPSDPNARRIFAAVLDESGAANEAMEQAQRAVDLAPTDSASHAQLASVLVTKHDDDRAVLESRRAIEFGSENVAAHRVLSLSLLQSDSNEDAIKAARDGLAVAPFNADLQFTLATALARTREFAAAADHFAYALLLRPAWPEARANLHMALVASLPDSAQRQQLIETSPDSATLLGELAWLLATGSNAEPRDARQALAVARRASALTRDNDPEVLDTLAAAYGEAGQFDEAIRIAERARDLAHAANAEEAATIAESLLASFRRREPFRETSP